MIFMAPKAKKVLKSLSDLRDNSIVIDAPVVASTDMSLIISEGRILTMNLSRPAGGNFPEVPFKKGEKYQVTIKRIEA